MGFVSEGSYYLGYFFWVPGSWKPPYSGVLDFAQPWLFLSMTAAATAFCLLLLVSFSVAPRDLADAKTSLFHSKPTYLFRVPYYDFRILYISP